MNKQLEKIEEKNPQEEKIRRKDTKMIDNVLKTLTNIEPEEKFDTLVSKYKELYEGYRQSQNDVSTLKKRNTFLTNENEQLTIESNKLNLAKTRLEKLSREFQRQNKLLKEENFIKIKEEEERRRKITAEFQKALSNVTAMMAESNEQNNKLGEENKLMARRLSTIYEDFKNRQCEVDRFSKQIDLERQLSETRIAKLSAEFSVEKEKLCAEKDLLTKRCEYLTTELKVSNEKTESLEKTVEEFQKAITKSSDIFYHCKTEIANFSEHISNQKKELLDWQTKHEKNLMTIQELTNLNNQKCKLIDQVTKKQTQLARLCRRLQAERTAYINALRNNGYNPDDIVVEIPEEPEEVVKETGTLKKSTPVETGKVKKNKKNKKNFESEKITEPDSLTVKEIQLAELKEELKRVQQQVDKIQSGQLQVKIGENPDEIIFVETEKSKNNENNQDELKQELKNVPEVDKEHQNEVLKEEPKENKVEQKEDEVVSKEDDVVSKEEVVSKEDELKNEELHQDVLRNEKLKEDMDKNEEPKENEVVPKENELKNEESHRDDLQNEKLKEDMIKNEEQKVNEVVPKEDELQNEGSHPDNLRNEELREDMVKNEEPKQDVIKNQELKEDIVQNEEQKEDVIKIEEVKEDTIQNEERKQEVVQDEERKPDVVQNEEREQDVVQNEEQKQDVVQDEERKQDVVQVEERKPDVIQNEEPKQDVVENEKPNQDLTVSVPLENKP